MRAIHPTFAVSAVSAKGMRMYCHTPPTIIHGRCFVVLTNLLNQQFDDLTNYIYYSICQKIYHSFKKLPSGSCQCVLFRLFLVYLHYIFLKKFCRAENFHAINKYIYSKGFFGSVTLFENKTI